MFSISVLRGGRVTLKNYRELSDGYRQIISLPDYKLFTFTIMEMEVTEETKIA